MRNRIFIISGISLLVLIVFMALVKQRMTPEAFSRQNNGISVSELSAKARLAESKNSYSDAKNDYQELINNFPNSSEIMNWQHRIEELNMKLIFSSEIIPKSILYEIKPGDSISKIAKQFKTTPELIIKANNLSSNKIFPGKKIKVWNAPLSIVVDKSQNILILKSEEEIIKTYIVSTGADNSTPVGTFKIVNKLEKPTWFKAGAVVPTGSPENILGTHWMGFELAGYGIHGTIEPQNLGKQVTLGCVRMANSDVEELYTIVPQGTEVTIID